MTAVAVAALAAAYLVGSIPFGVLFARARGVDLQKVGSGNIGATNAARVLGKKIGAIVLLCDAAKGYGPVTAAHYALAPRLPDGSWWVAGVGCAAFLGHLAPPWLRFRGGKGVATAFGVFLALAPGPAFVAAAVFALVYALTRVSSIGSLAAATAFVPAIWWSGADRAYRAAAIGMWVLIVVKHRANLARLMRGEEKRL
jgi:glycerol-3-phosphate acyltransferase PlsY